MRTETGLERPRQEFLWTLSQREEQLRRGKDGKVDLALFAVVCRDIDNGNSAGINLCTNQVIRKVLATEVEEPGWDFMERSRKVTKSTYGKLGTAVALVASLPPEQLSLLAIENPTPKMVKAAQVLRDFEALNLKSNQTDINLARDFAREVGSLFNELKADTRELIAQNTEVKGSINTAASDRYFKDKDKQRRKFAGQLEQVADAEIKEMKQRIVRREESGTEIIEYDAYSEALAATIATLPEGTNKSEAKKIAKETVVAAIPDEIVIGFIEKELEEEFADSATKYAIATAVVQGNPGFIPWINSATTPTPNIPELAIQNLPASISRTLEELRDKSSNKKLDYPYQETVSDLVPIPPPPTDDLLASANYAYRVFTNLGPFYGKDEKGLPPTFRVSATPLSLDKSYQTQLQILGKDLFILAQTLSLLPPSYKESLGNLVYSPPITWRVDMIFSTDNTLKVNEIQVNDGASALMIGEQMAYGLQTLDTSTANYLTQALRNFSDVPEGLLRLGVVLNNGPDPYKANDLRLAEFMSQVGDSEVTTDFVDASTDVNWNSYDCVMNAADIPPFILFDGGLAESKLAVTGDWTALGNKGVFALLREPRLSDFWLGRLGPETFERLQEKIIGSNFILDNEDLEKAKAAGKVAKVYWMQDDRTVLSCSNGVFGPWSEEKDWKVAKNLLGNRARFIAQDFIEPRAFSLPVRRAGGKLLGQINGYNRICAKYVVMDPANLESEVVMTATEATIGKNIKPAGRDCCFTAVNFV